MASKADRERCARQLGRWALRAAATAHCAQRSSQVWPCIISVQIQTQLWAFCCLRGARQQNKSRTHPHTGRSLTSMQIWTCASDVQVYACLADELPEEACHQLLVGSLGHHTGTAQDHMWHAAEAISLIETAAARARRTGSTDRLCASLLTALQRCWFIPFCCRRVCMFDEQP